MIHFTKPKILLSIQVLLIIFCSIVADRIIEDFIDSQEYENFFETPDGTVPDPELVRINLPRHLTESGDYQFTLKIYARNNWITVTLTKVMDNFLVSSNTGIWNARNTANAFHRVAYYPAAFILDDLNILFYHDSATGSALSLFSSKTDSDNTYYMSGIIAEKYAIKRVPFSIQKTPQSISNWTESHAVQRSVNARDADSESTENHLYAIIDIEDQLKRLDKRIRKNIHIIPMNDNSKTTYSDPLRAVVYPKVLITIHGDSAQTMPQVTSWIQYAISFWNIIDMIYRKLSNPKVRLNIAGFIVPWTDTSTPYVMVNTSASKDVSTKFALHETSTYFYDEEQRFPHENYNILVIMTTKRLCKDAIGTSCQSVTGIAFESSACSTSYWNQGRIKGVAIASFDWNYKGASVMVSEIAYVLGVRYQDGDFTAHTCSPAKGNLMAPNNQLKNLDFSWCSQIAMRTYLQSHDALCLIRRPITIPSARRDLAGTWLSVDGQCQNHFNNSESHCTLPNESHVCKKFGCKINGICTDYRITIYKGSNCRTSQIDDGYCDGNECKPKP